LLALDRKERSVSFFAFQIFVGLFSKVGNQREKIAEKKLKKKNFFIIKSWDLQTLRREISWQKFEILKNFLHENLFLVQRNFLFKNMNVQKEISHPS